MVYRVIMDFTRILETGGADRGFHGPSLPILCVCHKKRPAIAGLLTLQRSVAGKKNNYYITTFTMRPGTTMTLRMDLPSSCDAVRSSSRTMASTSVGFKVADSSILKRTLPLNETG